MVDVNKVLSQTFDPNKKYLVRGRSVNNFGNPSEWSDSVVIDTSAITEGVGLVQSSKNLFAIRNDDGDLVFGAFSTKAQRENKIVNPSFETNLNTWNSLSATSTTRVTESFFSGNYSIKLRVIEDGKDNIGITTNTNGYWAVSEGEKYTLSAHVLRIFDELNQPIQFQQTKIEIVVNYYDSSNNLLSKTLPLSPVIIPSGQWARVHLSGVTVPPGAQKAGMTVQYSTENASDLLTTEAIYIDAVMAEESKELDFYFDGASVPGTSSWSGTPHASSSLFDNTSSNTIYISGSVTIDGYIPNGGAAADVNANKLITKIDGDSITANSITGNEIKANNDITIGSGATTWKIVGTNSEATSVIRTSDATSFGDPDGVWIGADSRVSFTDKLQIAGGNVTLRGDITADSFTLDHNEGDIVLSSATVDFGGYNDLVRGLDSTASANEYRGVYWGNVNGVIQTAGLVTTDGSDKVAFIDVSQDVFQGAFILGRVQNEADYSYIAVSSHDVELFSGNLIYLQAPEISVNSRPLTNIQFGNNHDRVYDQSSSFVENQWYTVDLSNNGPSVCGIPLQGASAAYVNMAVIHNSNAYIQAKSYSASSSGLTASVLNCTGSGTTSGGFWVNLDDQYRFVWRMGTPGASASRVVVDVQALAYQ